VRRKTIAIECFCFILILGLLAGVTNQYFGFGKHVVSKTTSDAIFSSLDEGDIKIADLCLDDMYKMPRFDPVKISPPITWEEDPYPNARYWRLNFYGLRFTTNLLYAGTETGNSAYYDKLLEILDSFLNGGINKTHSWDDFNGVAWRAMVLTNTWLKLHERDALPDETSTKILEALEVHGDFLADANHYQPQHNHGITESAALLFLATSFPDMPGAEEWSSIAKERLAKQLVSIVDEDGVLVENSPYYHFFALQLYREICRYTMQHNITISDEFDGTIEKMISYGTYILQPNLEVPLLGASIERKLNLAGQYEEMAISDPNLLYVLTEGKQGKVPPSLNKYYPAAGQTIMRSGWGKGSGFEEQTQVIFDVGNFRTTHSDLDALSFNLYSNGITLMPDAGLYAYPPFYAYEEEDPLWSYFRGTSAHNTVVVDGMDQKPYSAKAGVFLEGEGYVFQSAEHELYNGISHQRAMALLGHDLVLIVDRLISDKEHKYEQMFHLFPEAKLDTNGLTVTARGAEPSQSVTIYQLLPEGIAVDSVKGQASPPEGWCSKQYGVAIANYSISYEQHGKAASYITLLEIGQHDKNMVAEVSEDQSTVNVHTSEKDYSVKITRSAGSEMKVSIANNDNVPLPEETVIETFQNAQDWVKENRSGNRGSISIDKTDYSVVGGRGSLQLTSPADGSYIGAVKNISLDLSDKNIIFRMKVSNRQDVNTLELSFSTDNWKGYVTTNLENPYRVEYDNEWITVALGKGKSGQWREYGSGFDWSNIDKVRFRIGAEEGTVATLRLDRLSTTPGQKEGAVIIVFDDASRTTSAAADIMNKYGLKGNVAVIGQHLASNVGNYLTLEALIELQDVYGWNVVNHSGYHMNALSTYYDNNDMAGLENDILTGVEYLIKYGINSAPNWYIYPNGATNSEVKEIVGKYYKFARLVSGAPDVFPFGEPLGVRALLVLDNTTADEVKRQVLDAKENKLTLFLTFHRIKTSPTENVGYDIKDFENIMAYISEQGIKVKTLSELDKDNGVSVNRITITDAIPEQIVLDVKINK
jgi:peptidoglycan/xylan/chitin deacetylase (PgdA/CDA1 family)